MSMMTQLHQQLPLSCLDDHGHCQSFVTTASLVGQHHSYYDDVNDKMTRPVIVGKTIDYNKNTINNRNHPQQLQQKRWKHTNRMKQELEKLDEMAHRYERAAAQERRKKKKERNAAKKKGKKRNSAAAVDSDESKESTSMDNKTTTTTTTTTAKDMNDTDKDLWGDIDDDTNNDDDDDLENNDDEEPSLPDADLVKETMMSLIDRFEENLKSIRGAEPTAEMFDDILVNAYGSMTPLKAVGQVVIVSPTLAQITCFDPSVAKDVTTAIQLELELNPQIDEGGMVKVPLPRVSMEVREQTAKQLKKKAEACRQRLRRVRRKAMDAVKKGKDGKLPGISKDDAFASGKEVEAVTESAMNKLQQVVDKKMDTIIAV